MHNKTSKQKTISYQKLAFPNINKMEAVLLIGNGNGNTNKCKISVFQRKINYLRTPTNDSNLLDSLESLGKQLKEVPSSPHNVLQSSIQTNTYITFTAQKSQKIILFLQNQKMFKKKYNK